MIKVGAIVGPTAVGKTEVSVEVAEALGAEIVSLDSMQLYRHMDIGTDKTSRAARSRVPHHLIDVFEPDHDVTVAEFQALARRAIEEIAGRGRVPLLVGGSGLYFRAVVDDIQFPPTSPEVRKDLERQAEDEGAEAMHARLAKIDPDAAAKIEPENARRTIRALEVIELTGRLFSENATWERYESRYELAIAGLHRERQELYDRIERRAAAMVNSGLINEVESVAAKGMGTTARQGLGYRQVLELPDARPDEIAASVAQATKRFARRQLSWFKADPRVKWFEVGPNVAQDVVAFLIQRLALPA